MKGIQVYDSNGKKLETLSLDFGISKRETNPAAYSCAIRVLMQNWRQGTVGCKTRGEVAFSGKKPWKQKGTGRARAGTISSPLWRKGGVIFGPQPRTRMLKFPKKQAAGIFNNLFFDKVEAENLVCLSFNETTSPKTKIAYSAINGMGLKNKNVVLFLNYDDMLNFTSFRNMQNINIVYFDDPNAFDLSKGHVWVFLKKDVESFKNMVSKWN